MARIVQEARLGKREQRSRLAPRKKPYWRVINEGQHLGYYRGARVGKWVARYRAPGSTGDYKQITIGEADDTADADGTTILSWEQAQNQAVIWFSDMKLTSGRSHGPYSVSDALDDYLADFEAREKKSTKATKSRIEAVLKPALGSYELVKLNDAIITSWMKERAAAPAQLRTSRKAESRNVRIAESEEARRRRRSTVNRDLTVLKAALNLALRNRKIASDDAWKRVKPFPKADAAKLRYLSDAEAKRLVNACDPSFRPLVQAALLTGARYGELTRLKVRDFNSDAGTLMLVETKGGRPRVVYLEEEGKRLVIQACHGKSPDMVLFPRPDGHKWNASQQARPLAEACNRAKLEHAGFHDLRRTYGARLALRGVPMAVIAEAMGHADERITRRHYAHLAPSYVADTVRAALGGYGLVALGNVTPLSEGRGS